MYIILRSRFLPNFGFLMNPAKITVNTNRFTSKTVCDDHGIPADVKFDLNYGFFVFCENYSTIKPLEIFSSNATTLSPVFLFPGFEGRWKFVEPLITNLNRTVFCFQYPFETAQPFVHQYVDKLLPLMRKHLNSMSTVKIIAHSFGGLVAMEIIRRLELENHSIRLCLLDSSPAAMKYMAAISMGNDNKIKGDFDIDYIVHFAHCMKIPDPEKFRNLINAEDEWSAKLDTFFEYVPGHRTLTKFQIRTIVNGLYNAVHAILNFDENFPRLNSKTVLFRSTVKKLVPFPQDFEMEKSFVEPVPIINVKGHHFNMMKYQETADFINTILEEE